MLLRNIHLRQGYQVEVTAAERGGKTSQRSKDLGFAWVYNRLLRAEVVGGTAEMGDWRATGSELFYSAYSVPDLPCEPISLLKYRVKGECSGLECLKSSVLFFRFVIFMYISVLLACISVHHTHDAYEGRKALAYLELLCNQNWPKTPKCPTFSLTAGIIVPNHPIKLFLFLEIVSHFQSSCVSRQVLEL